MSDEEKALLGPLGPLLGIWEGEKGDDVAPKVPERHQVARSKYRERMEFEPTGRVDNHEQVLYGLRYRTTAWRLGEDEPFHEELGYWMWDAENQQVMRCFMVPRGVTVIAGGTVAADATSFELQAEVGSQTYGICSNKFLDENFRTVRYELEIEVHDEDSFSYTEDTVLQIPGRDEAFHHTDANTMRRVK